MSRVHFFFVRRYSLSYFFYPVPGGPFTDYRVRGRKRSPPIPIIIIRREHDGESTDGRPTDRPTRTRIFIRSIGNKRKGFGFFFFFLITVRYHKKLHSDIIFWSKIPQVPRNAFGHRFFIRSSPRNGFSGRKFDEKNISVLIRKRMRILISHDSKKFGFFS